MKINHSEYKILIVDDVASNIMLLKAMLAHESFNVVVAMNGAQALKQVEAERPDLILLDVMMPDMSGYEVAQKLKENSEFEDIPIIFVTALNSSQDIVNGFKAGGNDFISKPFNVEELVIRVSHQLTLVSARRIILQQTENLKNTIQSRDKMYSVIAHDLRSPLGSLKMVLNMLVQNISSEAIGEDMYDLLTSIDRTTEELFSLLDNLLKWTKSQTGRLSIVYQNFNMVDVLNGVVDIFIPVAQMKNISLVEQHPDELNIVADIDMVKTVIRNLIINAIKFTADGGKVEVNLEDGEEFITISVQDNGCGISKENQAKLLHPETHYTTFGTNKEDGSGLGLLLCQDFVVKNGGKLWIESEEGVGSKFSFTLPKNREEHAVVSNQSV